MKTPRIRITMDAYALDTRQCTVIAAEKLRDARSGRVVRQWLLRLPGGGFALASRWPKGGVTIHELDIQTARLAYRAFSRKARRMPFPQ